MLLLRGREAVMQYFRPGLREHGITEQQWRVLRALSSVTEIEVTALAKATFLLAPSLTRILRDLEKRHLVRRRQDERDMRRNLIAIAPKGLDLIDTLSPRSEAIYAEISQRVGHKKLQLLQSLLRDIEAELAIGSPDDSDQDVYE
jgi:homoprotocatechuate degradation regulator HpaR